MKLMKNILGRGPIMRVLVGCCGIPVSRKRYFETFKLVELQNTFYDLPTDEWAKRFRTEVPSDAIITVKAWQAITHPSTSPTWKRMKHKPPGNLENYGFLRPTRENLEAWDRTLHIARILNAKAVVFQTPPSFRFSEENLRNVVEFFKTIYLKDLLLCWEPRGDWNQHREALRKVVELGIIHVVDVLKHDPVMDSCQVLYTRLHGLGKGEVNYKYKYTDDDLRRLVEKITSFSSINEAYVLFNNVYMFYDAQRFRDLARSLGITDII